MFDHREASVKASGIDPFIGAVVFSLLTLLVFVIARASGLTWKGMLHWNGELLLVLGILLAAKGISDVRREWTQLPGMQRRAIRAMQAVQARAALFAWARWNKFAEGTWLGRRLHLRPHRKEVTSSGSLALKPIRVSSSATAAWDVAPANGTLEERVAWLEKRMQRAGTDIGTLGAWHEQEVMDRQAATKVEEDARIAEDQRIRQRMADLAGGGLRLQTWGVLCLLAGTIMTAIW